MHFFADVYGVLVTMATQSFVSHSHECIFWLFVLVVWNFYEKIYEFRFGSYWSRNNIIEYKEYEEYAES